MRSGGSVLLIEGRGVVAGAGDAEDVLGGVLRHELHHEVCHVEHGAGAPGAALLADHHAAQVGQLQQEVQRSIHLSTHQETFLSLTFRTLTFKTQLIAGTGAILPGLCCFSVLLLNVEIPVHGKSPRNNGEKHIDQT